MNLDLYWFSFLNAVAGHSSILDQLGIFFAAYSEYVWAVVLLLVLFFPKNHRERNRVAIVLGVFAALFARLVVKGLVVLAYPRPRPFVALSTAHQLISSPLAENYQSFPSGHAIFFFALATVLFCFNKKWGSVAVIAATVMGIARVYVGVHWPSDILGGALLGALTGWCTYRYFLHHKVHITNLIVRGLGIVGL
jgi:undecaprenyl-diphosphatase